MSWPDTVREQFDLVDRFTTDKTEYYGPYNTLLTDIFPHTEHFQIVPQTKDPQPQVPSISLPYISFANGGALCFSSIPPS
jgi:hypothetical protein